MRNLGRRDATDVTFEPIELHTSSNRVLNSNGRQLQILFWKEIQRRERFRRRSVSFWENFMGDVPNSEIWLRVIEKLIESFKAFPLLRLIEKLIDFLDISANYRSQSLRSAELFNATPEKNFQGHSNP